MYTNHVEKDEQKKTPVSPEQTNHKPRLVRPEDESYGELMMRFTAHPVKPKYWFEEFGDHWTCSCGQINKGEICTNCGLERDLLRKLFILHKPSSEAGAAGEGPDTAGDTDNTVTLNIPKQTEESAFAAEDSGEDEPMRGNTRLVIGVIIVATLLLLATGAFLYFVLLPEMQEQDAAKRDSVRISLTENLPLATAPLPSAQRKSYISAGDMLCDKGKYQRSLTYYNKAVDLKDDESVRQKILDAKFGYVQAHQDDGEDYFETYLNELVQAHYDGAQSIYNRYYAWDVTIVANNLENDFSTDMKNVNRNDTVYFHTTLTGGAPGESIRLYYQITWPDGTSETKDVDSSFHAGSHFSSRFQYAVPLFAKPGKLTFEIYNKDSHDLLGSDSIKLKK